MLLESWLKNYNVMTKVFAQEIGVSRSQVHKYMHERAIPRYEVMLKIFHVTAKAVTPNDFYGLTLELLDDAKEFHFEDYADGNY